MTVRRDLVMYASLAAVLVSGLIVLFFVGPRWLSTPAPGVEAGVAPATEARKIRARLFYVDPDGEHLTAVEQEVPFGDGTSCVFSLRMRAVSPVAPCPGVTGASSASIRCGSAQAKGCNTSATPAGV